MLDGDKRKLWGFTFTLGYSRVMIAEAATDQKVGTVWADAWACRPTKPGWRICPSSLRQSRSSPLLHAYSYRDQNSGTQHRSPAVSPF
jgi:hypothetical protein